MPEFQKGSEWRRWDLHMHTPETNKNDEFYGASADEKWNGFYSDIEAYVGDGKDPLRSIAVIGITDYLSIDNYQRVKSANRLPQCVELILPNVEMRIAIPAHDSPINIHFIFDPAFDNDIESRFFGKLKFKYTDRGEFSATRAELVRLGKTFNSSLDGEAAYKKGVELFLPSLDAIKELFEANPDMRDHVLVAVSNSSTDGVSGIGNGTGQMQGVKRSILHFTDAIFSGNPSDRDFYLGKKDSCPIEVLKSECGGLKPCIHGCDAHKNGKLFEPDSQRYCWIKADPTFNGLKQIIYEPEERVCISSSYPQGKPSYQVIESITIMDDAFQAEPIYFNDKLTCIIGGKSTGKSILLHNLARAIAPDQVQEKCEVSSGKGKSDKNRKPITLEIDPSKLIVRWANGQGTNGQSIVYIPQTYLNRLADSAQEKTEIDEIIEKVLLDRIDPQGNKLIQKKMELLAKVDEIKSSNTNKLLDIIRLHAHILATKNEITELGGEGPIEQELKNLRQERDILNKRLNIKEEDVTNYDDAVNGIAAQSKRLGQIEQEIQKIESIAVVVQQSEEFSDCSEELNQKLQSIIAEIIAGANETWALRKREVLSWLSSQKDETVKAIDSFTQIRDDLKDTIESSIHIKELANKIAKEGEKLKEVKNKTECLQTEQERMNMLIENVASSCFSLRTVYNDYAECIKESTVDDDSGLKYDVQIPFRQDDFLAKWSELYRATSPQNRAIIDVATFCPEKFTKELLVQIIIKTLNKDLSMLKAGENLELTLRNIIDDWYNVKYIVKMGNDSIDIMSPGKKALVLLQLLIDLADSECPILIDQPEDDLDNRSIFEQLIPFIKRKKITRQVIVVTHNANIVVGSDAEEIIVANQDGADCENKLKRFEYRSGSIENDYPALKPDKTIEDGILSKQGIQQHICDILEGGIRAFEKRKNKYRFIR